MSRITRYAVFALLLVACLPAAAARFNPFGPALEVEAGGQHACAIDDGGQVHCWGFNAAGQLGIGSLASQLHPTPVTLPSAAVAVTLGQNHSCAITAAGTSHCWGWNNHGQVGTGSGGDRLSPVAIAELGTAAVDIAAGQLHSCAVLASGGVKCWGRNNRGQLGNGDPDFLSRNRPVDVLDLNDAVRISAGANHTCALRGNGDVTCWGAQYGLGTGSNTATNRPGDRALLPLPATGVASGTERSCAVLTDGRVFCWSEGMLVPTEVQGLPASVASIVVGEMHACALTDGKEVYCWGLSRFGEAGYAARGWVDPAVLLPLDEPTTHLAAGTESTCARSESGTVRCWGSNSWGQTGSGSAAIALTPQRAATSLRPMNALVAAMTLSCAITQAGQLWCVGPNFHGQAGTGNVGVASPLSPVAGGIHATAMSAGWDHACTLSADGEVYCWGDNRSGQLGYSGAGVTLPQVVALAAPASGVTAAAAHTCAVVSSQAHCWGNNSSGQLGRGNGAPPASGQPAPVLGLPADIAQVSTGLSHSCAITASGAAYCWGSNADGKLGDGTMQPRLSAVPVETLSSGVSQISAGGVHTCAVKSDGTAWCWGNSLYGALGNGGTVRRLTPEQVNVVDSPYVSIAAGHYFTCATTVLGDVYCSGYNAQGQLGIGSTTSRPQPQRVARMGGPAVKVTTGTAHACATDTQGSATCWGMGQFGQLANGAPDWSQPQVVVVIEPLIFASGFE